MRRRTLSRLVVHASLLGALTFVPHYGILSSPAVAQEAAFKQKEIKIKPGTKEAQEKATEKKQGESGQVRESRPYGVGRLLQRLPDTAVSSRSA